MKSRNYMIMAIAIIFAVWSAGQMARKAWAVEPAAPTVNTYGMANNTPTSATLKGDYRPNDLQIDSVYFEYGTTISYGTKISEVAHNVQTKVKYTLDKTVGLAVDSVNIFVQGVRMTNA